MCVGRFFLAFLLMQAFLFADEKLSVSEPIEEKILHEIMLACNTHELSGPKLLSHTKQLVAWSSKHHQSHDYMNSSLKFFLNSAKRVPCFNARSISGMLDNFETHLKAYMHPIKQGKGSAWYDKNLFDRFTEAVRAQLILGLSNNFDSFKKDPEIILSQLALEIAAVAQEEHTIEQLRHTIIRFLELSLGKIVWSPLDQEKSWESLKTISNQLARLMKADIIQEVADLDDLLWTAVERYCLFIELTGSTLSDTFYAKVKHELAHENILFVALGEQNDCMRSKGMHLMQTIETAQTNAQKARSSL
jgi:hypothetical protein